MWWESSLKFQLMMPLPLSFGAPRLDDFVGAGFFVAAFFTGFLAEAAFLTGFFFPLAFFVLRAAFLAMTNLLRFKT
jgi:hypothetical protein